MDLIVLALMIVVMSGVASLGADGKLPRPWAIVLGALACSTLPFDLTLGVAHAEGMSVFSFWAQAGAPTVLEVLGITVPFGFFASWMCLYLATVYSDGKKRKDG